MLQVTDRIFARPWVGAFYGDASTGPPDEPATLGALSGLELGWNLAPSWSVVAKYELLYLGFPETSHVGRLFARYYW